MTCCLLKMHFYGAHSNNKETNERKKETNTQTKTMKKTRLKKAYRQENLCESNYLITPLPSLMILLKLYHTHYMQRECSLFNLSKYFFFRKGLFRITVVPMLFFCSRKRSFLLMWLQRQEKTSPLVQR